MPRIRGADVVARTLQAAGLTTVYTLSGNHIMALFDAAIGTALELIHVRHEAAAVHMADAHARLTGRCGVAWVTGGPGHANAVGALYTALAADSPLLLVSGHAPLGELGRGAFQEMDQAAMAAPVTKASRVVASIGALGHEIAEAVRIATSDRPGPVHLSLPSDLLEAAIEETPDLVPSAAAFTSVPAPLPREVARDVLSAIAGARRPLILAGPMMASREGRRQLARLETGLGVPAIAMESPRGINDPSLGAFAEVLAEADLLVLLAKPHDFTLRFADPPTVSAACRFAVLDPDHGLIARVRREKGERMLAAARVHPLAAIDALLAAAAAPAGARDWLEEVRSAVAWRPPAWTSARAAETGRLHPVEVCAPVARVLADHPEAVLVIDGGEFGQWAQSLLAAPRRVLNGVAGAIGSAIPFAIAARKVEPTAPVVALLGDGTFGFHMAELDTAVRADLPFVAIVGNDAAWNAEHQIQLRSYGAARAHGCELLATRYDQVVAALGGYGECVTRPEEMAPALARAMASGKPTCINVMIGREPAPVVRRKQAG